MIKEIIIYFFCQIFNGYQSLFIKPHRKNYQQKNPILIIKLKNQVARISIVKLILK